MKPSGAESCYSQCGRRSEDVKRLTKGVQVAKLQCNELGLVAYRVKVKRWLI